MASSIAQLLLSFLLFPIILRRATERKLPWSRVIAISAMCALVSMGVHYLLGRVPSPTDAIEQWVRTGHF
jgi:hypothetical protein